MQENGKKKHMGVLHTILWHVFSALHYLSSGEWNFGPRRGVRQHLPRQVGQNLLTNPRQLVGDPGAEDDTGLARQLFRKPSLTANKCFFAISSLVSSSAQRQVNDGLVLKVEEEAKTGLRREKM